MSLGGLISSGLEFPSSEHTRKPSPQSLFLTNLFSGAAATTPSPDPLCSWRTGCSRDYGLLSGGDRMQRGWGASAGTRGLGQTKIISANDVGTSYIIVTSQRPKYKS